MWLLLHIFSIKPNRFTPVQKIFPLNLWPRHTSKHVRSVNMTNVEAKKSENSNKSILFLLTFNFFQYFYSAINLTGIFCLLIAVFRSIRQHDEFASCQISYRSVKYVQAQFEFSSILIKLSDIGASCRVLTRPFLFIWKNNFLLKKFSEKVVYCDAGNTHKWGEYLFQ